MLITLSKPWLDASQYPFNPPVWLNLSGLVEGEKMEFGLPVALKEKSLKSMNFGLLSRTELAWFVRLLGSKSVTTSPGRLFTPILSMKKDVELIYWDADPSTEVFNGLMFIKCFAKLELLPWLGLKISTLTLGVMWISLLGVRKILSTCTLSHTAPVTISFKLIFLSFFGSGHRDQIACSLLGGFSKPRAAATQSLDSVPIYN